MTFSTMAVDALVLSILSTTTPIIKTFNSSIIATDYKETG